MNRANLIAKYGEADVELCSEIPDRFASRQEMIDYIARQVAHWREVIQKHESGEYLLHISKQGRAELQQDARGALAWWERELEINTVIAQEEATS